MVKIMGMYYVANTKRINEYERRRKQRGQRGGRELRPLGHHIQKSYRNWTVKKRVLEALEGDGMHRKVLHFKSLFQSSVFPDGLLDMNVDIIP